MFVAKNGRNGYRQEPSWSALILSQKFNGGSELTLSLLMSYIQYMELLVKSEILTSYIYGPTFGNAESRLFLFYTQCFNTESMQKFLLSHSCV
jgi:hypothetical protein